MPDKEPAQFDTAAQGPFAALYYRDFRLFWTGLFISNVGSWMQITAISWLLLTSWRVPGLIRFRWEEESATIFDEAGPEQP